MGQVNVNPPADSGGSAAAIVLVVVVLLVLVLLYCGSPVSSTPVQLPARSFASSASRAAEAETAPVVMYYDNLKGQNSAY
jgi:hypothetical protein